jgi:hypothetical protein
VEKPHQRYLPYTLEVDYGQIIMITTLNRDRTLTGAAVKQIGLFSKA